MDKKRKREHIHGGNRSDDKKRKEPDQPTLSRHREITQRAVTSGTPDRKNGKNSYVEATEGRDADQMQAARVWLREQLRHVQELQNDPNLQSACVSIAGEAFINNALAQTEQLRALRTASKLSSAVAAEDEAGRKGDRQSTIPPLPKILDAKLAKQTFTHRSAVSDNALLHSGSADYERLEFIGDSYLYSMCAVYVAENYPTANPGKMSRYRQELLQNETLAQFSRLYEFDKRLEIEPATDKVIRSNAKSWKKVMGDVFEAYIAALIQSRPEDGWSITQRWMSALWARYLPNKETMAPSTKTAKATLSKKVHSPNIILKYEETRPPRDNGPGREEFSMGVYLTGWGYDRVLLGEGKGASKTEAGAAAADSALENPLTAKISEKKVSFEHLRQQEMNREGGPRQDIIKALEKKWKG